jgi:hypothetical protein
VLLVPKPQRFRIFGSEEESSDSRHFFHLRSSSDPSRTAAPAGAGEIIGSVAFCAAMPSWLRRKRKFRVVGHSQLVCLVSGAQHRINFLFVGSNIPRSCQGL